MKNQALFSLKDKSKNLKCRLLQFLFVQNIVFCVIQLPEINKLTCTKCSE